MASWPRCFDNVFTQLRGVQGHAQKWHAFCPSHQDVRKRSLTMAIGNNRNLLMCCQAPHGCTIDSILAALGLKRYDLLSEENRYQKRKTEQDMQSNLGEVVAVYPYEDEEYRLLYEVVKYRRQDGGKTYRQRRPNPEYNTSRAASAANRRYLYNLEGVRYVPYRLPQLLTSLKKHKDHPVLVVEGERNVEDALALGISATTCPCGAGKVHLVADELRDLLKGRKVVVVCDDDPVVPNLGFRPGVEHGKQVGEVLSDVVKALKVVRLFDDQRGCDLSNFVELLEGDVSERRMKIWKHLARFPLWENGLEPHYLFYAFEPFASRVERQQQQVQVKSVGPVGNAMEAFGVLSTNYLSVQQALMSGDMEALLEAMARLAVVTNKVGNDLTNGQ